MLNMEMIRSGGVTVTALTDWRRVDEDEKKEEGNKQIYGHVYSGYF